MDSATGYYDIARILLSRQSVREDLWVRLRHNGLENGGGNPHGGDHLLTLFAMLVVD